MKSVSMRSKPKKRAKQADSAIYENEIIIKNAKENNLKGIDLTIPRDKLVLFTGISGSGKAVLPSTLFSRRDSAATSKACRLTQGSFSVRWTSPTWKASRDFLPQSP